MLKRFLVGLVMLFLLPLTLLGFVSAGTNPSKGGSSNTQPPEAIKNVDIVRGSGSIVAESGQFRNAAAQLNVQRVYRDSTALQFDASWGYLPGEHAYNNRIDAEIAETLRQFSATRGASYSPAAMGIPDAELIDLGWRRTCGDDLSLQSVIVRSIELPHPILHVQCEVVFAMGSQLGQKLMVNEVVAGEIVASQTSFHYVDTQAGSGGSDLIRIGNGADLFNIPADEFAEQVIMLLDSERWQMLLERESFEAELIANLAGARFNQEGRLLIEKPQGDLSETHRLRLLTDDLGITEPESLALATDWVAPFLSDWGRDVHSAAVNHEPYRGPGDVPPGQDHVNCDLVPCLAVTYDDGPWETTPEILGVLEKYDQAATFYVLGMLMQNGGWIVQQTHEAGHEIGNHSWNHPTLSRLDDEDLRWQFQSTNDAISRVIGERPTTFRPPYGSWNKRVLENSGMIAVLWNVDSNDWRGDGDDRYRSLALAVRPGDIVLFHDVQPQTVRLADEIIGQYTKRGFSLVTISQLLQGKGYAPGSWVYYR